MKPKENNLEGIKDLSEKEKISIDNKAIFKAKDLKLINEVREFLKNKGLNLKLDSGIRSVIRGGMSYQIKKGFLRTYNDVDLAIDSSGIKMGSQEYHNYVSAIQKLTRASCEKYIPSNLFIIYGWDVKDESKNFEVYVGLIVEYKFRISYTEKGNPKTKVDVTFGKEDADKLKDYWDRYLGLK